MDLQSLKIELPANTQIILAQSHFIKTVEDVSECLVICVPTIRYGVAHDLSHKEWAELC
jgi:adenosine/AMP kinase